jgi:hypothetical protein
LPEGLTHLELSENYIKKLVFPSTLISLEISKSYHPELDNLPDNLETLVIIEGYNNSIVKYPPKLKKLSVGSNSNILLDDLPSSLEFLLIGFYNKPINNFPIGLKGIVSNKRNNITNIPFGCKIIYS